MPRKTLKRLLPNPTKLKNVKGLGFLGGVLDDPHLFHLTRHSVSVAFFIGLLMASLPIPGQMATAALLAVLCRCNLPLSVMLCWLTNPFTMGPFFLGAYLLGCWVLGTPPIEFEIDLTWEWFTSELLAIWQPLFVGSIITGLTLATLGYISMQLVWRWVVVRNWQKRQNQRRSRKL